jgi:hypothetical protein
MNVNFSLMGIFRLLPTIFTITTVHGLVHTLLINHHTILPIVADDDGQGKFYFLIVFLTDNDDSLMQEQAHPIA